MDFALSWYAEGVREPNDAIAITKLASCLDTLSHGSKNNGIKQLICNLFNKEDNQTLFNCEGNKTISIHEFSKRIMKMGVQEYCMVLLITFWNLFTMIKKD